MLLVLRIAGSVRENIDEYTQEVWPDEGAGNRKHPRQAGNPAKSGSPSG